MLLIFFLFRVEFLHAKEEPVSIWLKLMVFCCYGPMVLVALPGAYDPHAQEWNWVWADYLSTSLWCLFPVSYIVWVYKEKEQLDKSAEEE